MKNHRKVNGKLLQINKKYSQLKHSQKEFISEDEVYNHLISKKTKYRNKMVKEGLIVEDVVTLTYRSNERA